jgi:hypothetical protein
VILPSLRVASVFPNDVDKRYARCSTSVDKPLLKTPPTAMHIDAFLHVTPLKKLPFGTGGTAIETTDHFAPFHCSIKGFALDDAG